MASILEQENRGRGVRVAPGVLRQLPPAPTRRTTPRRPQPRTTLDSILSGFKTREESAASKVLNRDPWYERGASAILGNDLVQGALYPLQYLSYPMKAIQIGAGEVAKFLPEGVEQALGGRDPVMNLIRFIDEDKVREDDRSTWDKITDPEFGYGQMAYSTGTKWGDRLMGLTGDVTLDPLTYLTAGTVKSALVPGRLGRLNMAAQAAREVGDPKLIRRLARWGPGTLSTEELRKVGARRVGQLPLPEGTPQWVADAAEELATKDLRQGLRFMGARVPGTEQIAMKTNRAFAGARDMVNRLPGARAVGRARLPEGMEEQAERLLFQNGTDEQVLADAVAIDIAEGRHIGAQTFRGVFAGELDNMGKTMHGVDAQEATRVAETQGGTWVNTLLEKAAQLAHSFGVKVPLRQTAGTTGKPLFYIPHVWTHEGRAWLRGSTPDAIEFRKTFGITIDDIDEASGATLHRKIVASKTPYEINGRKVVISEGTIDDINQALANAFPELGITKFLDDNITSILANYFARLAEDVGIIYAGRRLLGSKAGLIRLRSDPKVLLASVSEELSKVANDEAAAEFDSVIKNLRGTREKLMEEAAQRVTAVQGILGATVQAAIDELDTVRKPIIEQLKRLTADEPKLAKESDKLFALLKSERQSMERRIADINDKIAEYERESLREIENLDFVGGVLKDTRGSNRRVTRRRLIRQLERNQDAIAYDLEILDILEARLRTLLQKEDVLRRGAAGEIGEDAEKFTALWAGDPRAIPEQNVPLRRGDIATPDTAPDVRNPREPWATTAYGDRNVIYRTGDAERNVQPGWQRRPTRSAEEINAVFDKRIEQFRERSQQLLEAAARAREAMPELKRQVDAARTVQQAAQRGYDEAVKALPVSPRRVGQGVAEELGTFGRPSRPTGRARSTLLARRRKAQRILDQYNREGGDTGQALGQRTITREQAGKAANEIKLVDAELSGDFDAMYRNAQEAQARLAEANLNLERAQAAFNSAQKAIDAAPTTTNLRAQLAGLNNERRAELRRAGVGIKQKTYVRQPELGGGAAGRERLTLPGEAQAEMADLRAQHAEWTPPKVLRNKPRKVVQENGKVKEVSDAKRTPKNLQAAAIVDAVDNSSLDYKGSPSLRARSERLVGDMERSTALADELVAQGKLEPEVAAHAAAVYDELQGRLATFIELPATSTRRELEQTALRARTIADFIGRYTKAVQAGAEPSEGLARYITRKVLEQERERLDEEIRALIKGEKGVIDEEVDQMVEVMAAFIEDVSNAGQEIIWARKLSKIQDLSPGERIVQLRDRIAFHRAWQESRRKRLRNLRSRLKYAIEHPGSQSRPTFSTRTKQLQDKIATSELLVRQFEEQQRIIASGQPHRPFRTSLGFDENGNMRMRHGAVTRQEYDQARHDLPRLRKEHAYWSEVDARSNEGKRLVGEIRERVRSGELSVADVLNSDDPRMQSMTVFLLLTATEGTGKVKADRILATIRAPKKSRSGAARVRRQKNPRSMRVSELGPRQKEQILELLGMTDDVPSVTAATERTIADRTTEVMLPEGRPQRLQKSINELTREIEGADRTIKEMERMLAEVEGTGVHDRMAAVSALFEDRLGRPFTDDEKAVLQLALGEDRAEVLDRWMYEFMGEHGESAPQVAYGMLLDMLPESDRQRMDTVLWEMGAAGEREGFTYGDLVWELSDDPNAIRRFMFGEQASWDRLDDEGVVRRSPLDQGVEAADRRWADRRARDAERPRLQSQADLLRLVRGYAIMSAKDAETEAMQAAAQAFRDYGFQRMPKAFTPEEWAKLTPEQRAQVATEMESILGSLGYNWSTQTLDRAKLRRIVTARIMKQREEGRWPWRTLVAQRVDDLSWRRQRLDTVEWMLGKQRRTHVPAAPWSTGAKKGPNRNFLVKRKPVAKETAEQRADRIAYNKHVDEVNAAIRAQRRLRTQRLEDRANLAGELDETPAQRAKRLAYNKEVDEYNAAIPKNSRRKKRRKIPKPKSRRVDGVARELIDDVTDKRGPFGRVYPAPVRPDIPGSPNRLTVITRPMSRVRMDWKAALGVRPPRLGAGSVNAKMHELARQSRVFVDAERAMRARLQQIAGERAGLQQAVGEVRQDLGQRLGMDEMLGAELERNSGSLIKDVEAAKAGVRSRLDENVKMAEDEADIIQGNLNRQHRFVTADGAPHAILPDGGSGRFDRVAFLAPEDAEAVKRAEANGFDWIDDEGNLYGAFMDDSNLDPAHFRYLLDQERGSWKWAFEGAGGQIEVRRVDSTRTPAVGLVPIQHNSSRQAVHGNAMNVLEPVTEVNMSTVDDVSRRLAEVDEKLDSTRVAISLAQVDRDQMQARNAQLSADLKTLNAKVPKGDPELRNRIEDLDKIARGVLDDDSPEAIITHQLLLDAAAKTGEALDVDVTIADVGRMLKDAKDGKLVTVMMEEVDRHYRAFAAELTKDGEELVYHQSLAGAMFHLRDQVRNNKVTRAIEAYTDFFKTYVTAKPGFHIRNGISAAFMNAADDVDLKYTKEAISIFHQLQKDPYNYFINATPRVQHALMAMWGSGVGGQFTERGVGPHITHTSRIFNNAWTRASKKLGVWVEGPARLAMALDSVSRGATVDMARARVARVHFDYSQVSRFDRAMKRVIPFWTFMSRNLPLQITQMWLRPRAYLIAQSAWRNWSEPNDPLTPQYWLEQGAFNSGMTVDGDPLYLAPDLPHTRVLEDVKKLGDPVRLFSNASPLFRVPVELAGKRKLYSGVPIRPEAYEPLDAELLPLAPLFGFLGQANMSDSGQLMVNQMGSYAAREMIPPLKEIARMFPGEDDEFNSEREAQTWMRFLGIPAFQLSDSAKQGELRRRASEAQRRQARAANLARD